jgi:hypothetical protein
MRAQLILTQPCTRFRSTTTLTEDTGTVGEGVADGGPELPEDLAQVFFEIFVDADVLVVAEEAVGQLGELRYVSVGAAVFPPRGEGEVYLVIWGGRRFGGGCCGCAGAGG